MDFSTLVAQVDRQAVDLLGDQLVTYTPSVGSPVPNVKAIFDTPSARVDLGLAGIASEGPSVCFILADLPSGSETDIGALFTAASGTVYRVRELLPDGKGLLRILLHENV